MAYGLYAHRAQPDIEFYMSNEVSGQWLSLKALSLQIGAFFFIVLLSYLKYGRHFESLGLVIKQS